MRVLELDSGAGMGGGQWQVLRLVEALVREGHQVMLLARAGAPLYGCAQSLGLHVRPLSLIHLLRLASDFDLVHAHDARSHTLAALAGVRRLVVSRRVAYPLARGLGSRWKYGRAAHYISVSQFVKGLLVDSGIDGGRISVVYDGVPSFEKPRQTLDDGGVLLPASKDTPLAREACRLLGVSPRISEDLERDLPTAGLLLHISDCEGLGSALLLAMSAGVPVVASRVGGIPEIIEHGRTGLLTENTAPAIAATVRRLWEDGALAQACVANARRVVEEKFSVSVMVRETLRVYERVLSC